MHVCVFTAGKKILNDLTVFPGKYISKGAVDMTFSSDVGNNPSNPYIQISSEIKSCVIKGMTQGEKYWTTEIHVILCAKSFVSNDKNLRWYRYRPILRMFGIGSEKVVLSHPYWWVTLCVKVEIILAWYGILKMQAHVGDYKRRESNAHTFV